MPPIWPSSLLVAFFTTLPKAETKTRRLSTSRYAKVRIVATGTLCWDSDYWLSVTEALIILVCLADINHLQLNEFGTNGADY